MNACRDDARNVLVAMMAELGATYLYYAIQVLQNACPAKGYTAHVLGYTLHSILNTLAQVSHKHICFYMQPCIQYTGKNIGSCEGHDRECYQYLLHS